MTDYTELLELLRYCSSESGCIGCKLSEAYDCTADLTRDAAAAIEALQAEVNEARQHNTDLLNMKEMTNEEEDEMLEYIRTIPVGPLEPMLIEQLPKRGEWVRKEGELTYWYECSECGYRPHIENYPYLSDYCPNCGAKMNDSNASNALNALDNAQDGPIITPCRGCSDYDGYGGCKSKGGCARAKMEVQDDKA